MAHKDNFTASDWAEVVRGPMIASFAITAADPSGLVGTVQEAAATARALAEAKAAGDFSLASEVVAEFETPEGRKMAREGVQGLTKGHSPAEATSVAVDRLSRVARLVEDHAPDQADAYKAWLRELARKVAQAAKEGGVLGFGGVAVSDAERKTLADIDAALDDDASLDEDASPFDDGHLPV